MKQTNTVIAALIVIVLAGTITILALYSENQKLQTQNDKLTHSLTKADQRADYYQWRDQNATGHIKAPSDYPGEWRP